MGNYIQCHVIYNGKEYGKESILIYIYNDILIYIYIYMYIEKEMATHSSILA